MKPQTGQKCTEGGVSSVSVFLVPWITISEIMISESSKFNNSVILFICHSFLSFSEQKHHKGKTEGRAMRSPSLFEMFG